MKSITKINQQFKQFQVNRKQQQHKEKIYNTLFVSFGSLAILCITIVIVLIHHEIIQDISATLLFIFNIATWYFAFKTINLSNRVVQSGQKEIEKLKK